MNDVTAWAGRDQGDCDKSTKMLKKGSVGILYYTWRHLWTTPKTTFLNWQDKVCLKDFLIPAKQYFTFMLIVPECLQSRWIHLETRVERGHLLHHQRGSSEGHQKVGRYFFIYLRLIAITGLLMRLFILHYVFEVLMLVGSNQLWKYAMKFSKRMKWHLATRLLCSLML